jgi:hypothetical protein
MVSDKREFVRLDVGYLDNPKIADALDASPLAVLAHIASMTYCRQHRTDGAFATSRILRKVGATSDDARVLLDLGLWIDLGAGKAELHDYLKHQESSEQIARLSAAGKKGAAGRWSEKRNADRSTDRSADGNAEERRGEERRDNHARTADEPPTDVPQRADMNPDAILQSHGLPEAERPKFKAWLREERNVRSLAPWLTKVHAEGGVPEQIAAWRDATKPAKKIDPTKEWMYLR